MGHSIENNIIVSFDIKPSFFKVIILILADIKEEEALLLYY